MLVIFVHTQMYLYSFVYTFQLKPENVFSISIGILLSDIQDATYKTSGVLPLFVRPRTEIVSRPEESFGY